MFSSIYATSFLYWRGDSTGICRFAKTKYVFRLSNSNRFPCFVVIISSLQYALSRSDVLGDIVIINWTDLQNSDHSEECPFNNSFYISSCEGFCSRSSNVYPLGHLWYLFKVTLWQSSVKTTWTLPFCSMIRFLMKSSGNCDTLRSTLSNFKHLID